jgi:3-oxoacyl-[acyl-carrier protein] reductase
MALDGKTAIVTGAASGFGCATTRHFTDRNVDVVGVDIDADGLDETEQLVQSDGAPGTVETVEADVSRREDVAAFVEAAVDQFGSIDILVNNAGVLHDLVGVEALSLDAYDRTMAVNVKSIFLATKYAVSHMPEAGGGALVNIASTAGKRPRKNASAYVASKGAVRMLTKELALELAAKNVRVNAINPGTSHTSMLDQFSEAEIDQFESTIPLGRLVEPDDIARAVAFLADDEKAGSITGVDLDVDGGRSI